MAKDTKHLTAEHIKPALYELLEDDDVRQWLRKILGISLDVAQNVQKLTQENPEYAALKIQLGECTRQLEAVRGEFTKLEHERDVAQSHSVSLQSDCTQLTKKSQHIEQALLEAKAEAERLRQRSNLPAPYTEVVQHTRKARQRAHHVAHAELLYLRCDVEC
jgi:predicted  nucleic acid-binding Zn-ribbon protein